MSSAQAVSFSQPLRRAARSWSRASVRVLFVIRDALSPMVFSSCRKNSSRAPVDRGPWASARILGLAAHYGDLHAVTRADIVGHVVPGMGRLIRLGGVGTPEVAEFAPASSVPCWACRPRRPRR